MKYHILTLFPEMIEQGLHPQHPRKSHQQRLYFPQRRRISGIFQQINSTRVDDYPYGGGAGMVMEAEPMFRAYQSVVAERSGEKPRTVYLTLPQGKSTEPDDGGRAGA